MEADDNMNRACEQRRRLNEKGNKKDTCTFHLEERVDVPSVYNKEISLEKSDLR